MLSGSALLVIAMENAGKRKILQGVTAFIPDSSCNLALQKLLNNDAFCSLFAPKNFLENGICYFPESSKKGSFPTVKREEIVFAEERFKKWYLPIEKGQLIKEIESWKGGDLSVLGRKIVFLSALAKKAEVEKVRKSIKNSDKVFSLCDTLYFENEHWIKKPFPILWGVYCEKENSLREPLLLSETLCCLLAPREKISELKNWFDKKGVHVPLYALEEEMKENL